MKHLPTARRLIIIPAMLSAALLVTSCSGPTSTGDGDSAPENVSINFAWWGDDDRALKTQEAIDLFEAANPGISINVTYAAFDAYNQKLATQLAGGGAPDVFMVDKSYFREYADRGVLADLGKLDISTGAIPESYLEAGKIDGTTYGIAPGGTTQVMAYNADIWEAAGLELPGVGFSWDDLTVAGSAISSSTDGATVALSDFGKYTDWFAAWLQQNGETLYTSAGEFVATEGDIRDFWTFTTGLGADGVLTSPQVTAAVDGTAANSGVVLGSSAGELTPLSALAGFVSATTATLKAAPLPTDTDNTGMAAQPSQMYSVAETSKHKEAAASFIAFMLTDLDAGKALGVTRGVPTNLDVLEAITPQLSDLDAEIAAYMTEYSDLMEARVWAEPTGASAAKTEFIRMYEDVIFDRVSVKDAAAQMYTFFVENIGA